MPTSGEIQASAKAIEVLKDIPLWLLGGLAVALGILTAFVHYTHLLPYIWFFVGSVFFGVLFFSRLIAVLIQEIPAWKSAAKERVRFYLTPIAQQSHLSSARQADDSVVTQIAVRVLVKNRTDKPLSLTRARLIKPRVKGEIVHEEVSIRALDDNIFGNAYTSGHFVPPGMSLPGSILIMIRGVPPKSLGKTARVKISVTDDEGYQQTVLADVMVIPPVKQIDLRPKLELVSSISDPVERNVVSVLQAEFPEYDRNGRRVGGLGSLQFPAIERKLTAAGTEPGIGDSEKTTVCELQSANLGALLTAYKGLSPSQRDHFASVLLARLDGDSYLRISYFIVAVLWKIGKLKPALEKAKASLPQGEIKVFGLSNVLMLLNTLLRNCHPDFTDEMLDDIASGWGFSLAPVRKPPRCLSAQFGSLRFSREFAAGESAWKLDRPLHNPPQRLAH